MQRIRHFHQNWGWYLLWLQATLALVAVSVRPVAHHYIVFSEPARLLWTGQSPYGAVFSYGAGGFHYSPACAMLFFSPFAWLPERFGQFCYLSVSLGLFAFGILRWTQALRTELNWNIFLSPYRHLVFLMIASELVGSVLAAKLEIAMLGLLFLCGAWLLEQKRSIASGFLLLFLVTWKFQPIPVWGLVAVALWHDRRAFRTFLLSGLLLAGPLCLLPFPFWSWHDSTVVWHDWLFHLSTYARGGWLDPIYQHIYVFLLRCLGIGIPFATAQAISVAVGIACAFALLKLKSKSPQSLLKEKLLFAISLGSGYVVLFSPLSQSNAYLWYSPVLFGLVYFAERNQINKKVVWVGLSAIFILVSLAYSDLCPRPLYHWIYPRGVKALGGLLAVVLLLVAAYRNSRKERSTTL
jgi:hypothetical protein